MNVLLVKPPERSTFNFGAYSLGALAAVVRDVADVEILDATDLSLEAAATEVEARRPDLVGVTAMGFRSTAPVAAFLRALRARLGLSISLVAGGHGASSLPGEILAAGADAVVLGEGEITFRRLVEGGVETTRPGDPGLALLADGRVVAGPPQRLVFPLDRLPPPARDLMPPPVDGVHLLETSRGCPHECSFCEATRFYGRRWRAFSPARVAAEVRRLVEDCGAFLIEFADDNVTASPDRILRLCDALRGGPLPACFFVSARADDLTSRPDLLPAMAEARMLRVGVGVETLDPAVAARVGKPIPAATYREAFQRMRDLGIFSVASLIVGLPGETPEARERTAALAVEAAPDAAGFLPFLPVPGAPDSGGRPVFEPDPADLRDAGLFNRAFYDDPGVRARLEDAVAQGGVRGLFARGTLERQASAPAPESLPDGGAASRARPKTASAPGR